MTLQFFGIWNAINNMNTVNILYRYVILKFIFKLQNCEL